MKTKMFFNVESAEIVGDPSDSQFATARIEAFHTGTSLHNTTCDDDALIRTASTLYEKPIIYEWNKSFRDFGTHSDHPVISGFVMANSAEFIRKPDGRLALSVFAKIWKRYAPQFISAFTETNTEKRSVSVELEVLNFEKEGILTKLTDWAYSAICVLGEMVTPASPDSNIQMLSFAEEENKKYLEAYTMEFASRYSGLDFSIPSGVKRNAKKGISIHQEKGGGKSTSLAMARHLMNSDATTPERLKQMKKYFDKKEDSSSISYMLWGGNAGKTWCKDMCNAMGEIDEKQSSFFATEEKSGVISNEDTYGDTQNIESKEDITQMAKKKIDMADETEQEEMAVKPEEGKPAEEEMAVEKPVDEMASPVEEGKKEEEKSESKEEEKGEVEMAEPVAEEKPADEAKEDFSLEAMMAKMKKLEDENKVYLAENIELKDKFAKIEEEKKNFAVDTFLAELNSKVVVSPEAQTQMKDKSASFTYATLEAWKNECKAMAFEFAKRSDVEATQSGGVTVFALPYKTVVTTQTVSVWDNLNK